MQTKDTWFGQPKGLTILFLTEMWEKFSFFGMRALQIYYMTKELQFSQATASLIFGSYAASVYLTPIFGGIIADRWLGRKRAVIIGGLLMAVGHFMMTFESMFFIAMAFIALGNGLFLPNLPSQVPLLYPKGDPRAVSAFNVYYVGVNLGGFLAPLICGALGEIYGWHYGFGAAGIGMCLGLLVYVMGSKHLPSDREEARPVPTAETAAGQSNIGLLLSVWFAVVLFRSAYEQTGNTLAIWADTSIDRLAFGWQIPVTWFQSLNPMFVFLISPLLVQAWMRREARGIATPPALSRMTMGAVGVGAAFGLLAMLIFFSSAAPNSVSWIWLVVFFAVFTLAELHILPIGLGLFAVLAPARFGATTIAAWFSASFAGNFLSGVIGTAWEYMTPAGFFLMIAGLCCFSGLLLSIIQKRQRQPLMQAMPRQSDMQAP
ncbi:peptide MFS transporter [Massilia sp. SM-13]|uniref:peptide MFS transporter n=1 Tax=Pseudoduganella rhizocola TaxID=3382643 RepID=UPI0038B61E5D